MIIIETPADWWHVVDQHWDKLLKLIVDWHPASGMRPATDPNAITARMAEGACALVRSEIEAKEKHLPSPEDRAHAAKEARDQDTLISLFNSAWFGIPESIGSHRLPGFGQLCDLCSESYVFQQEEEKEGPMPDETPKLELPKLSLDPLDPSQLAPPQPKFRTIQLVRDIPEKLHPLVSLVLDTEGCYIAGGFVRWLCSPLMQPVPFNDIDILCLTDEAEELMCSGLDRVGYKCSVESKLSYTYKERTHPFDGVTLVGDERHIEETPAIQVIKHTRFPGDSLDEALGKFDLSVCQAALLTMKDARVNEHFQEDERDRRIRFTGFHHLYDAFYRVAKYARKGYHLPFEQQQAIWIAWDNLSPQQRLIFKTNREAY